MFISLLPNSAKPKTDTETEQRARPETRNVRSGIDLRSRHAAIAWAIMYTYLVMASPGPDPSVVATTAQTILGWVLTAAIVAVFATSLIGSMSGRKLAPFTLGASAIGGGVLSYNGIDCIMAGHTNPMFYVMAFGGAALVLHALATVVRRGSPA